MKPKRHCKDCGTLLWKDNQADLYLCKDCASDRQIYRRLEDKTEDYIEHHLKRIRRLARAYTRALKERRER